MARYLVPLPPFPDLRQSSGKADSYERTRLIADHSHVTRGAGLARTTAWHRDDTHFS